MLYFLLTIIAIGILLLSDSGKALLNSVFSFAFLIVIIIALVLFYNFLPKEILYSVQAVVIVVGVYKFIKLTVEDNRILKKQAKMEENILKYENHKIKSHSQNKLTIDTGDEDKLYQEAKDAVMQIGKASTSYLQRKLRIGYAHAARLMDILEERGVIGPADGERPREVIEFKGENYTGSDNPATETD